MAAGKTNQRVASRFPCRPPEAPQASRTRAPCRSLLSRHGGGTYRNRHRDGPSSRTAIGMPGPSITYARVRSTGAATTGATPFPVCFFEAIPTTPRCFRSVSSGPGSIRDANPLRHPPDCGGVFVVATMGLVPSAIAALRGSAQAYIAGVVLLGNVFLIRHASAQYADVPLMFFYAAAVSLMVLHDEVADDKGTGALALGGLAAGLAAWTKNEGLLFLVALMVAHFAVVARANGLRAYSRQLLPLAAGVVPVLLILHPLQVDALPSERSRPSAGRTVERQQGDRSRPLFRNCRRVVATGTIG